MARVEGQLIKRGEIYYIDLGIPAGSEQGGLRPVLIIQNDLGNRSSLTTIVAAITSKQKKSYAFHVEITASESGLRNDSVVLLEQIRTVNQSRLRNKVGCLSSTKMHDVNKALKVSLEIT